MARGWSDRSAYLWAYLHLGVRTGADHMRPRSPPLDVRTFYLEFRGGLLLKRLSLIGRSALWK